MRLAVLLSCLAVLGCIAARHLDVVQPKSLDRFQINKLSADVSKLEHDLKQLEEDDNPLGPSRAELTNNHLSELRAHGLNNWAWKNLAPPRDGKYHVVCAWLYNRYFPYYTVLENQENAQGLTMEQSLAAKCEGTIDAAYQAAASEKDAAKYYLCSAFVTSDTMNGAKVQMSVKTRTGKFTKYFECLACTTVFPVDTTLAQLQEGYAVSEVDTEGSNKIISTAWFGNPGEQHKSGAFDSITRLAEMLGPLGYKFNYYYERAGVNVANHDFGEVATPFITLIEVNPADGFRDLLTGLPHVEAELIDKIVDYMQVLDYVGYKACSMAFKKDLLFIMAAYKHGGFFLDTFFRLLPKEISADQLDEKFQTAVAGVDWPMYPMNGANMATDTPDLVEINALYSPSPNHPVMFRILSTFINTMPTMADGRYADGGDSPLAHQMMLGMRADKPPTKLLGELMVYSVSSQLLSFLANRRVPPQFAVWDTQWVNWIDDHDVEDARKHLLFSPLGIVKVYSGSHRKPHCGPTNPTPVECAKANRALESQCAPFLQSCCTAQLQVCAVANSVANCS